MNGRSDCTRLGPQMEMKQVMSRSGRPVEVIKRTQGGRREVANEGEGSDEKYNGSIMCECI